MNGSKVILALWLGATAWGQVKPAQAPAKPPVVAPPVAAPAVTSPKPSSASRPAQPAKQRRTKIVRHVSRPAPVAGKSGAKPTVAGKAHRDPFVSPIVDRSHSAIACVGSGKQCLEVGEISLHGVVRGPSGFIAVVVNGQHTYFLRENDPLANGQVERITKDSIVLRERYSDDAGRPVTREVTRKLGASSV